MAEGVASVVGFGALAVLLSGCGTGQSSSSGNSSVDSSAASGSGGGGTNPPIATPTVTVIGDGVRTIEQLTRATVGQITTEENGTGNNFLVTSLNGQAEHRSAVWQLYVNGVFYLSGSVSSQKPGVYVPPFGAVITWVLEQQTLALTWQIVRLCASVFQHRDQVVA